MVFRLCRRARGPVRSAMKTASERNDLVAAFARMQPRELNRRFVRFGPRIAEERLATEAPLGKQLGPAPLGLGVPRIGNVNQFGRLLLNGFNNPRRTVPEQIAAPTRKEVE